MYPLIVDALNRADGEGFFCLIQGEGMNNSEIPISFLPGTQYGSNPGGIYLDETGERFYLKHYHHPEQARVEVLAARVFEMMGIATVAPEIRIIGCHCCVVSRWNPHLCRMVVEDFNRLTENQALQVGRIFCGAVLVKHWDVVGAELDNLLCHEETKELYAIDTGGAFHFRARGGEKEFGDEITELRTLREIAPASLVFNAVFAAYPRACQEGIESLRHLKDEPLRELFEASGLARGPELYATLKRRRARLLALG